MIKNILVKDESDKLYINSKIFSKNIAKKSLLDIKKLIFPPTDIYKLSQIMIDEESYKYITFFTTAQEITNIIMNNLHDFPAPHFISNRSWLKKKIEHKLSKLVITDMTAGVGGNVLNFAKYFRYVNAIEIDTRKYKCLVNNINIYEFKNVNYYNTDSYDFLINKDNINQDIIFFDPPWGGKKYKFYNNIRLIFDNTLYIKNQKYDADIYEYSIEQVIIKILEKVKMVVLKLPNNYDFLYFNKMLNKYRISKFNLEKMTIIIIKNY